MVYDQTKQQISVLRLVGQPPYASIARKYAWPAGFSNFCGGCHQVRYCNRLCQRSHWPHHKFRCRHRLLTPAVVLLLNCIEDEFPKNEEVHSDFHIQSFGEPEDRVSAFLPYKEILVDLRLSAWRLNTWVVGDCVREGIIQFYFR